MHYYSSSPSIALSSLIIHHYLVDLLRTFESLTFAHPWASSQPVGIAFLIISAGGWPDDLRKSRTVGLLLLASLGMLYLNLGTSQSEPDAWTDI